MKLQWLYNSRVSDQNGVSVLYIMLEMRHSGREPSILLMMLIKVFSIKYCRWLCVMLHALVCDANNGRV